MPTSKWSEARQQLIQTNNSAVAYPPSISSKNKSTYEALHGCGSSELLNYARVTDAQSRNHPRFYTKTGRG